MSLEQRIKKLSPGQRKLLELKLNRQNIDVLNLPIPPIDRGDDRQRFPLSYEQERLWFINRIDPDNSAYNIIRAINLEGNLNKQALEKSIDAITRRHETLRTIFIHDGAEPKQVIGSESYITLEVIDLKDLAGEKQERETKRIIRDKSRHVFDLSAAPLMLVILLEFSDKKHLFITVTHHIITDGASFPAFKKELVYFYGLFARANPGNLSLPELPVQYVDYAAWQRSRLEWDETQNPYLKRQQDYWLAQFGDEAPRLNLPTDYTRPPVQSFEGGMVEFEIDVTKTNALKTIAAANATTLYTLLLTIFYVFLAKISGAEDIVIGTPVEGRRHVSVKNLMGIFIKTLAIRNYPCHDKKFIDFLQEVKNHTIEALENQEYPYDILVSKVLPERDISRNPLFDVMFELDLEVVEMEIAGLKLKRYPIEKETSILDMILVGAEFDNRLHFRLSYCSRLFKRETAERFSGYIKSIVHSVIEQPEAPLSEIAMMPGNERRKILYDFNDTTREYPADKTVHGLFAEQAAQTPDRISVVYSSGRLTYKELQERSDRLACLLIEKGVTPGTIIGIMMERSLEMIMGIMGILKSGGAYLPIDPAYPQERIDYMLKDSSAESVVKKSTFKEVEKLKKRRAKAIRQPAASPAYVIYTSGSTGKPKGVMIHHRSVVNFITGISQILDFNRDDAVLSLTAVSFDIFGLEIYLPFVHGARTTIGTQEEQLEPGAAAQAIARLDITMLQITPSRLAVMLLNDEFARRLKDLKYLLVGGEAFPGKLLEKIRTLAGTRCKVYNMYGPTETTIWSTVKELTIGELTIGKPMANTQVYILGKDGTIQPINVIGDLYIGGDGLAAGYVNRPELTQEKFASGGQGGSFRENHPPAPPGKAFDKSFWRSRNLFSKRFLAAGGNYIYKTGDLARWRPDGDIDFLGRSDHQVKIRGFRIELEEIESRLLTYDGIKEAVVTAKTDEKEDKYLCAYFVSDSAINVEELKNFLSGPLPDYMIPPYFTRIDRIPLTPNGKVDHKALPQPEYSVEKRYTAPRNALEEKLAEIWAEVLGIKKENIGIDTNFFKAGGHSLRAAVMADKIHKELKVKTPLAEIFRNPSIRALAGQIGQSPQARYEVIEAVEKKEYYPLSSAQKRLYILHKMDLQSTVYNIPNAVSLQGEINPGKLEKTLALLIHRHDSLRTSFAAPNEEPVQRIYDDVVFAIEYNYNSIEHSGSRSDLSPTGETYIKDFIRPFDLSKAPLLRIGLVKTGELEHLMVLDKHHIIMDGISDELFIEECLASYRDEELPTLRLRYKDYTAWQNSDRQKKAIREQEEYWLRRFADETQVMDLPLDYPRPQVQSFAGAALSFELPGEITRSLNRLAEDAGATLYMTLLAIYNILLSKLSGQEDIVIGTPTAARRHADLQRIIGMFVNTLTLRNYPNKEKTALEFLEEIKETTLQAFENQEYQFEDLVERVSVDRDTGRNPLFDAVFALQNMAAPVDELAAAAVPGLKIKTYKSEFQTAKFDLALNCFAAKEKLLCSFEYCTKIFKKDTIERFIIYFKQVLSAVLENPRQKIAQIEIITAEEKRQILYDFNNTQREYPKDKTLHRIFEEQAEQTPDRISIVYSSIQLTYKELNKRSDRLACLLMEKGVSLNAIVGIMIERSLEMITGVLGILKAGGAYLPIDPDYPEERKRYMLNDSGAQLSISGSIPAEEGEKEPGIKRTCSVEPVTDNRQSANSIAYVIYTSGSTGKAKGVLVEHGNAARLVKSTNFIDAAPGDSLLLTGALIFDITTFEIWYPLLNGLALYLAHQETTLNAEELGNFLIKNRITILHLIPQLFNALVSQRIDIFKGLKYFLVGGDLVLPNSINRLRNEYTHLKIIHCYGPTENTTFSTTLTVEREYPERLPIGRPIQNSSVYIISPHGALQPIGVAGELVTGGDGVARGYLNNPELTGEKFASGGKGAFLKNRPLDPQKTFDKSFCGGCRGVAFSKRTPLLYRTGDLARWQPDGCIDFLGRIDRQVKIRGIRIESGEIESLLLTYDGIKEAVVTAKTDEKEDKYLCAYFVSDSDISPEELRGFLSTRLPDYMIPTYFIRLQSIPLTPTGKIDRKALPVPGSAQEQDYIAPRNEIEKKLAQIWFEVLPLKKDKISITANFFKLGGHSLRAAVMAAKIHKAFNIKLPLAEIFKNSNIRALAEYIKSSEEERYASINPVEEKEYYPLSPAQERLYILQQMDLESTAYNLPEAIHLPLEIDIKRLEESLKELIARHESLRTSFLMVNAKPAQRMHKPGKVRFRIEYDDPKAGENMIADFLKPFDLTQPPLLRTAIKRLTPHPNLPVKGSVNEQREEKLLLLIDMHHIISDGTSIMLLKQDFMALYRGETLPPMRIRYKDFSQWQNSETQEAITKRQETYWLKQFEEEIPVLDLPTDFMRSAALDAAGKTVDFDITDEETKALNEIAGRHEATLFMVILAIFDIFLSKISGREAVIVGTACAGRRHADLEGIIGMFVNTLPLCSEPTGDKTYLHFLSEVKDRTLQAFDNQDYPFEDLVEKVVKKREPNRNPLFDVMFALQNILSAQEGEEIKDIFYEERLSKFDLSLNAVERRGKLYFTFEYRMQLFREETILGFMRCFKQLISSVSARPGKKIMDLEIISAEEKQRLLVDFNRTGSDYPGDKTIHELFEEQAKKTPQRTAVVLYAGSLLQATYEELDKRADALAGKLIEKGAAPGTIIGLYIDRSLEMITGLLAILKAGAAYLPLDSRYPPDRIKYMLLDSNARITATQQDNLENIPFAGEKIDITDKNLYVPGSGLPVSLKQHLTAESPAYVLYTSGSTGKPKGVLVEHKGVVRLVKNTNYIRWTEEDKLLLTGSIGFDITTFEIWGPLLNRVILFLADQEIILDGEKLEAFLYNNEITILHLIPQLFNQMAEISPGIFKKLTYLLVGGDVVRPNYVNKIRNLYPHLKILHMYGPTENTTFSTFLPVDRDYEKSIPIGSPIANSTAYILDRYDRLQARGISGELCVGGAGVAKGYLNNPELTREKFVSGGKGAFLKNRPLDPQKTFNKSFCGVQGPRRGRPLSSALSSGNIMEYPQTERCTLNAPPRSGVFSKRTPLLAEGNYIYKTGDLARRLTDGNIEFQGRIDQQIKIRGFRIELGDLENMLRRHEAIEECVAISREIDGELHLIAYYKKKNKIVLSGDLREYLSSRLPDYMIPSYFVQLEQFPLTQTGKIDRAKLPEPEFTAAEEYKAPRNKLEENLVRIWRDVLNKNAPIGIADNFFEIGGHSLKAAAVTARMNDELKVKVPLMEFFKTPTVEALARYIQHAGIENIARGDERAIPIKIESGASRNLFLIHDGTGEVDGYVEFCKHLGEEYNCWGIRADRLENLGPRDITIEGLAQSYIETMKKVQPDGPYFIAGWSLGGTIAFEIAARLEHRNERIGFLGLIDSPPPHRSLRKHAAAFNIESEGVGDSCRRGVGDPDSSGVSRCLSNARALYTPQRKINTPLHYFAAGGSRGLKKERWRKYTHTRIEYHEVAGDHYSIFKMPAVADFAVLFTNILKKCAKKTIFFAIIR